MLEGDALDADGRLEAALPGAGLTDRLGVALLAASDTGTHVLLRGLLLVLRLDAFLEHAEGLRAELGDPALGDTEEVGEFLGGATLEEVAHDDEAVTLREEVDGVGQVRVELAVLHLLAGLTGGGIGKDVDQGQVLVGAFVDLVFEGQHDRAEHTVLEPVELLGRHAKGLGLLFGIRQAWDQLLGRERSSAKFVMPWVYKFVRHPLYLGFLVAFWFTPTMTVAHLVFAVMTSGYILVAIQLEERDLVNEHGESYRSYRRRVPMLIPSLGRRAAAPAAIPAADAETTI